MWCDLNIYSEHFDYPCKKMPLKKQIQNIPYIVVFFNLVIGMIQINSRAAMHKASFKQPEHWNDAFGRNNKQPEAV